MKTIKKTAITVRDAFIKTRLRMFYGRSYVSLDEVKEILGSNPYLAPVGRVTAWLKNPKGINPLSCSNVVPYDSYHVLDDLDWSRFETIAGSREFATILLKMNAGVAIHLHKLRPKGTVSDHGLVATGTPNFVKMFSLIVEEVKQGNTFKRGAVVVYTDATDPDVLEFIGEKNGGFDPNEPNKDIGLRKTEIPWAKRAIMVEDDWLSTLDDETIDGIIRALDKGTIFLTKIRYDKSGARLYTQVCTEIYLKSRSTCNLMHVNLAAITSPTYLRYAFEQAMKVSIGLWQNVDHTKTPCLNQLKDRQVGVGVIGLANMLANFKVTYADFTFVLTETLDFIDRFGLDNYLENYVPINAPLVDDLVYHLIEAYDAASKLAIRAKLERAFTIAPTANSSARYMQEKYVDGKWVNFNIAPEISPPVADPTTKAMERVTTLEGQETKLLVQYPPNIELAHYDVSADVYFDLACAWQRLMNIRGLAHTISFNVWNPGVIVNRDFMFKWTISPLGSLYYRWNVDYAGDKTSIGVDVKKEDEWDTEDVSSDLFSTMVSPSDGVDCPVCAG